MEQNLLKKVKKYLDDKGFDVGIEQLSYSGIRKNSPLFEGKGTKPMHIVSFSIEAIKDNPYSTNIYTVTIDVKTDKLEYIIGKNIFEKIDE